MIKPNGVIKNQLQMLNIAFNCARKHQISALHIVIYIPNNYNIKFKIISMENYITKL